MTSEAYQDSSYDKRGQKRPSRPKLLKLTEVSMPHRNRKKIKTKVKERSQSNVRDRIYDDPAYTDDISHLAIPMRRSSGPDKIDESLLHHHKKKISHKDSHFSKRTDSGRYQSDGSSSSDNMPPDPGKHKRGQSLEGGGNIVIERSPKKREKRDRSAKQKRNLSLDNTLSNSLRRSLEKSECSLKTASIERQKSKPKSMQRQNASESWSSCLAATSDSSKATEGEEPYAERKEPTKMQIGKRFLRGEIGIKSFNYYLLKEGLKSSKKFVDKQRSSLTKGDSKKPHSRSEENIYEEIFFVDKNSDAEDHSKYPDCELCMQQCTKENCEYCLEDLKNRQYFGSLGRNTGSHNLPPAMVSEEIPTAPAAHILQYQSYNPNNPGVYKIETTPVAFTSDYNPIHQLQIENQKPPPQRRFSRAGSQVGGTRINTKSSSSSDSLHHKYARDQSAQDLYECNHSMIYGAPQMLGPYEQKIYKSDSKVSIISEYSVRSESSNRNFRCGEVSDSSLGDSMFSYSTQRRYFGSSESCRFAFECRRCSLDGEKCSFSDTCRYECRNCDCSSSYFSSDFDDYSRKNSTGMSNASQKSYEYYNDTIDVKQNKYAQDFIKHVNDVKRSIYQAELQRTSTTPGPGDHSYGTIPPPKQMEMKKSMNHYQQMRQYQQRPSRSGSSPFRIAPSPLPLPCNTSMTMKDIAVNRDNKNVSSGGGARTTSSSVGQTTDKENSVKVVFPAPPAPAQEDNSLKYSEGKYAQAGAATHHSSNNSGRLDKKDSLERSQRKQTGAIPKLSSSSANSSHQSHRNQRAHSSSNNNNSNANNGPTAGAATGGKEGALRALASVPTRSPRSSPKHAQPNGKVEAATKIPMRPPTRADYVTTSVESKKLITLAKTEESQRTESKEQVMCQDNHNPQKSQSVGKGASGEGGSGGGAAPIKIEGDATESHPQQQIKEQSRQERRALDEQRQRTAAAATKSTIPEKRERKLSEWSGMEEMGDDDVFIDAPPAENVDMSVVKRQKSPSPPLVPPTEEEQRKQIEGLSGKGEEEAKEGEHEEQGRKVRAKPPKEAKQQHPQAVPISSGAAALEPSQASAENIKRGPPPDSSRESTTATAASAAKEAPTRAPRTEKAPPPEKTKAQQSKKTPSSAELSMKAKQQTVEPVWAAAAPAPKKTSDAAKGEPEETSPPSTAAKATGASDGASPAKPPTTTTTTTTTTTAGASVEPTAEAVDVDVDVNAEPPDGGGEVHPAAATSSSAGAAVVACAEEISRESDVAGAAAGNRDTTEKALVEKEHKEEAIYLDIKQHSSSEESRSKAETAAKKAPNQTPTSKIDICDLPLPELPPKKRRNRDLLASAKFHESLRRENDTLRDFPRNYQSYLPTKRRESFDSAIRTTSDARKMHYHNLGHMTTAATNQSSVKPTYLFGENHIPSSKKTSRTDEIYLNKSGWVQVSSKRINDENSASVHNRKSNTVRLENQNGSLKNSIRVIQIDNTTRDKPIYAVPKVTSSKIEELISRSEARRNNNTSRTYMKPGYKIIDPQIASILNERPGFLPVNAFADSESPPPVTPILSPPPAFQDSKSKYKKSSENVKIVTNPQKDPKTSKGMVFSRSFEYDRKPADYSETFSKSFDSNLSDSKPLQRDRSPNFSTLTGCSPNYLTKRESSSGRSRESSPKYQKVGTAYLNATNLEPPAYSNPKKLDKISRTSLDRNERSRRAQFSRVNPTSRFRSFDTAVNQRLNSCDSGARSDLSNDELDNEEDTSTEFLSANYQPQSMYKQSKPRSLTPDKYDPLGSQKSLRKQRSLTPESRSLTPEDRRKKSSQTSLSSRQNSSSRSNTLERKQKYEDKSRSPSRSSSSSSYSGREHEIPSTHRRTTVKNIKTPEEHRIRRSRSLQLTERSPSRAVQSHKMVVCLGKPANQTPFHHPIRSFPPTIRPDQIVTDQTANNSRSVRSDIDKSRSFDLDYGKYGTQPVPARLDLDFEKSRSFDEDYREQSNNLRYLTDTGIVRDDRNVLKPNIQRQAAMPRQTSPQNYGTRLCDHELTYDMLRRTLDRSPIMDFSRDYDVPKTVKSREVMNLGGNEINYLNERIYDHGLKLRNPAINEGSYSIDRYKTRETITPESEMKSMRDSLADERLRSGVTDYIYRQPMKSQQHPQLQHQQRSVVDRGHQQVLAGSSTPSRGSCTASSCDFWPHCGVTNLKTSKNSSVDRPNDFRPATANSISDPALAKAASDEDDEGYVIVQDVAREKTSGGVGLAKVSATRSGGARPKYNRKSFSLIEVPRGSVIERIKSKPPIYVNTGSGSRKLVSSSSTSASSALFLGEREMPITRERDLQNSPTAQGCSPGHAKLGEMQNKQGPGGSSSADFRTLRSSEHRQNVGTPNRGRPFRKQRSQSLPNVFLQTQFPSTSSRDDNIKPDPFSSNLSNQIRAVSSPSLSENPSEIVQKSQNGCNTTGPVTSEIDPYTINQNYAGVLQKFKKTFSQLKSSGKQITPQTSASEIESGKYRFGPLIWRSSKERRKAKYNRRDKCNSGDSGIQIELENDENYIHEEAPESIETSPSLVSVRVRRTNSAKTANSSMTSNLSAKAKALKKIESYEQKLASTPLPTRSLSQPSGLDRMARAADLDESDTDSVSSHPDLHEGHRSIYAEVLYPFTPAGPQELGLEKGSLIEVLRKDIGPWWYGRVKHDAVIAKVIEPQQGWFPKEFVRVIPPFFGHQEADDDRRHFSNDNTLESCDTRMNSTTTILPPPRSLDVSSSSTATKSMLSSPTSQLNPQHSESLRNSVIKELLETEINYVKLLSSLCLGYLREMRKRVDIFPPDSLNLIFSNIESIWRFQQTFLDALRKGIEIRRIAQVFLDHQSAFLVYSNYCNSYPRALMELETYASSKDAKIVLENCRLAERLPELPLSAHLLAPIQRICRYPLHLAELVKQTPTRQMLVAGLDEKCSSHEIGDCKETLEIALAAMKKVTETVNEGKRHSEHLTRFQASFENFQGPPIAFHSTRFFMQTDATRVSPNLWNNTYTLFLFDHQLIYCKKDILKRNHYIYKGRIFLDNCRILNLPDGKLFGITLKNALRIYCESRNKWFDFCFRSASRKLRFLSTLAVERQFCGSNLFVSELVGEDDDNLSDREYHSDYDTPTNTIDRGMSTENFTSMYDSDKVPESPSKLQKYSDTLPKKSRKTAKDGYEYNTGSLGRRKIGNWFRKAKSTNSTPTQSPTHHSMAAFNSDSSSQSSPALGYKPSKSKVKDSTS